MVAIGFVVAFSAAIVTLSIGLEGYHRAIEERDHGYTTTYGDHNRLWQLDPKTGEVLRQPGERTARRRHP